MPSKIILQTCPKPVKQTAKFTNKQKVFRQNWKACLKGIGDKIDASHLRVDVSSMCMSSNVVATLAVALSGLRTAFAMTDEDGLLRFMMRPFVIL
ncbi:MAG: hypothetical protein LBK58_11125 [Prevotellaceae bacterium]|jgi:hypothetical protein|nr:hypothetical protein [Prevotellaceae bacterium]